MAARSPAKSVLARGVLARGAALCSAVLALSCCADGGVARSEPVPMPVDQDSIEACVLESAVSGRQVDCIGLWSDSCTAEGFDSDRCAHLESRLWVSVLLDSVPPDGDLPYPAIQKAIAACERAGGPPGRCERDGTASVAIPVFLAAESD